MSDLLSVVLGASVCVNIVLGMLLVRVFVAWKESVDLLDAMIVSYRARREGILESEDHNDVDH